MTSDAFWYTSRDATIDCSNEFSNAQEIFLACSPTGATIGGINYLKLSHVRIHCKSIFACNARDVPRAGAACIAEILHRLQQKPSFVRDLSVGICEPKSID